MTESAMLRKRKKDGPFPSSTGGREGSVPEAGTEGTSSINAAVNLTVNRDNRRLRPPDAKAKTRLQHELKQPDIIGTTGLFN
jgi:hypothetical protein